MMNKSIKKRLERLAEHTTPGEVICFVFSNGKGAWFAEWNDGKNQNRKDGFQSVDEALEFAKSLNKVSDIFYHHRQAEEKEVITIVDEWLEDDTL